MKKYVQLSYVSWVWLACICLSPYSLFAQAPQVAWFKQIVGTDANYSYQIEVDEGGNTYIIGLFSGSAAFGGITLSSQNSSESFLAKYDPSGNVLWVNRAGKPWNQAQYKRIALDKEGNCWLTGDFHTSISFGNYILSSVQQNCFLAKIDPSGNAIWALKSFGVEASAVAVDTAGNAIVGGSFFGARIFGSDTITASPDGDLFLAKYDYQGNPIWIQKSTSIVFGNKFIQDIAVDKTGSCYFTGSYQGSLLLDTTTLPSGGGLLAVFTGKLNAQGNIDWVKPGGGFSFSTAIAIDSARNVYIAGGIGDNAHSGQAAITFDSVTITTFGKTDIFVAKYDSTGNMLWIRHGGSTGSEFASDITTDKSGNVYVTGHFAGNTTIGLFSLPTTAVDMFICKYTSNGDTEWVKRTWADYFAAGNALVVDKNDNVYVVGSRYGDMIFGNSIYYENTNNSYDDTFIAKLSTITGFPASPAYNISTYPNPFFTSFQISLIGSTPTTATLTDMLGRQVHRQVISAENGSTTVTITPPANLPSGMYILRVKEGENLRQVRVMKQ